MLNIPMKMNFLKRSKSEFINKNFEVFLAQNLFVEYLQAFGI